MAIALKKCFTPRSKIEFESASLRMSQKYAAIAELFLCNNVISCNKLSVWQLNISFNSREFNLLLSPNPQWRRGQKRIYFNFFSKDIIFNFLVLYIVVRLYEQYVLLNYEYEPNYVAQKLWREQKEWSNKSLLVEGRRLTRMLLHVLH